MQGAKEAKKAELREQFFQESKFDDTRQRFGLFSFTGTLAISQRGYEEERVTRRDGEGGVRIGPRNFTSSPVKKGKGPDAYFTNPSYVSIGDPYRERVKPQKVEQEKAGKMKAMHGAPFRASGPSKIENSIEYVPQGEVARKVRKDPEGGVYFGPRNFYTSPTKTDDGFSRIPEYIEDPYDRKKKSDKPRTKGVSHERAFRAMGTTGAAFFDAKTTYGEEGINIQKKPAKVNKPNVYPHEKPFLLPSNTKHGKEHSTFEKFPEAISDPEPKPIRKGPDPRAPFKVAGVTSSKPSPSIASMVTNIKAEFASARFR